MTPTEHAMRLVTARRDRSLVPSADFALVDSLDAGFAVQKAMTALYDEPIVGWKVAMPPDAILYAPIYANGRFASGARLGLGTWFADGIECELAFTLDRSLPPWREEGFEPEVVLQAFGLVSASFELLQCRLEQRFGSPRPHLVADHLGNAGIVLGGRRGNWQSLDLAAIELSLAIDGSERLRQRGGNPLGDPRRALTALVNHLGAQGVMLEVGQVVMTGAFTGIHRLKAERHVRLAFEGLEPVEFSITDEGAFGNAGW
jgi:2-keto-4-pentenoate hydratase